ncbi:3-hydroxy-9,10-secoandrosta-1,3,5(10)-triene-9,17-dione monooxygenase [Evansella vedderi]|uniref:3-hydroxy-9,10-secoandrosta-1,3,5(10)-triene-9, 17-dione monooxygenase n=1 Tax=Evansella vedderi TaxID=38282 RepID=A0ABU0A2E3_9BACI|nr:acyl-CoA dehydrogenase family protein [Evansella vedderi]MDQ0257126.1 3-hydroxy-9,10-secoandrosta-1,3,5(10)-triene-9,17-dione monooxygenase [Evansella vedderi]
MFTTTVEKNTNLVQKARSFVPRLRGRTKETEAIRKIPDSTIKELKDTGLFHILRSQRFGGFESNMRTYTECVTEISRGCGSTGWVYALCCIRELMISESFSEKTHEEIYGSGEEVIFAGVFEPRKINVRRVEGGYMIEDGFWPFCSGSLHATWGYFGMPIVDEEGKVVDQGLITVPMCQVEIADDWHVVGLRGTGSNSIYMKDVFVPDHRVVSFTEAIRGKFQSKHLRDIALYNTALFPALAMSLGVPALGMAKAALELFTEKLPYRKAANLGVENLMDATVTHHQLADVSLKVETAAMHFYQVADNLDAWAASGKYMDKSERVKSLANIGYAVQQCKEAIDIIILASGSAIVADGNPIQQISRDFSALYTHRTISPVTSKENYGRTLCGLHSNTKNI